MKLGMGLVCFRCGDAHRRADCRWTGQCSRCGKEDHKEVVCKMNPNGKVRWEQVFSSPSQHGSAHMMANTSLAQQFPTPLAQQFLPAPLRNSFYQFPHQLPWLVIHWYLVLVVHTGFLELLHLLLLLHSGHLVSLDLLLRLVFRGLMLCPQVTVVTVGMW